MCLHFRRLVSGCTLTTGEGVDPCRLHLNMHKCLTIYEILADIIKNADNRSKARCSLVCKSWSEVALDEVWEVIGNDDGEYLFRTLSKCKNIRKYGDSGGVEERRFLENLVKVCFLCKHR